MSTSWLPDVWKKLLAQALGSGGREGTRSSVEEWERIAEVLNAVLELPAAERSAFLDRSCAGRPELRREIDSLLAVHERPGLLDSPAAALIEPLLSSAAPAGPARGRTVCHYEILDTLGSGGMGVVYQARDLRLGRLVALKFLPPHLSQDTQAKERLRVEAQAAAALDHPHICTIHEIGETEEGQLFLAMPFYRGETLKQRIARGPLAVQEALAFAIQAAHGLARAHELGIVHRDIKPANLMVSEPDPPTSGPAPARDREVGSNAGGMVKILDFGVAKLTDVSLTGPGTTPGTVAYMSPEQARGDAVDHRTDLWALGVVLYEALTGQRPFRGEHEQAVVHAILHTEPEPVASLRAEVPEALARVVHRALSKRPEGRHSSVIGLAADLQRALESHNGDAAAPARSGSRRSTAAGTRDSGEVGTGVLPQGERRQTTILASGLSGYAELVERLVPEEVERVLMRLRQEAAEIVGRHGGMINHFTGEEMVLLFGIPTTHEDDSLRAVRTARELHRWVRALSEELERSAGQSIRLHSGIDSGHVVAHPLGGADSGYRVAGVAAHVAARLAAQAAPDEVWISPECRRVISPFFETEVRPPLVVREREQPLVPYRVIGESGIQTRLEAAERAGLTAFVGRERELETLLGTLEAALASEGQFVVVLGEAGMGKSRLLHELQHRLDPEQVLLLRGRCQSYGGSISYLPFIEVLRGSLHLGETGSSEHSRENTVARIREIGPELEEFVPLYLNLLSIPSEHHPVPKHLHGDQLRLATQDALAAILTLSARRQRAAVILLEDWHWADDASHAVLRQVVEMTPDYPLLVVVTCRPGSAAEWDVPGDFTTIQLRPLEASSSMRMLEAAIGVDSIPAELGALIHERAGGNPFFLEEICHTLVEEGTLRVDQGHVVLTGSPRALELPDTIHAVIRARLDRLERDAREVVRFASVVGREFTRGVLERSLPEVGRLPNALQTLKGAGLIQQTRVVPDAAYRFKHVLTQEVAYASLLEHQRRDLHGRVGEAIEQLHGNRLEEYLDRLAYHFSRAEKWLKAVHYGLRAAERASALSQFVEAIQILERVEGWLSHLPDGAERRELLSSALLHQERLCESLGLRGRQQQLIDALIALLEPGDDRARLAEVYVRQGDLNTLLRRFGEAEAALHRSLELRRQLRDQVGERNTLRSLGLLRWHEGRHAEALACIEQALAISREREDLEALLGDLSNLGNVLKAMGEYERAQGHLEQALALAQSLQERMSGAGAVFKQAYILHNLANIHRELGDNERALEILQRAVTLTSGERLPIQLSYHYTAIAHIFLRQGRVEESLRCYRQSVELERRAQYASGLSQSLRILGEVLIGLGRHDEALPHLEEAARIFARLQDRETEALMWSRIAGAHERKRNDADALGAWSKARTLRKQAKDRRGELEALEGIARVTRRHVAEPSLAVGYYREALGLAKLLGDGATQGRLCNTVGILEWTQGDYDEALSWYVTALGLFRELDDPVNEGLMLNSIGVTLKALGRREEAQTRLEEAVSHHRQTGQALLEGHALAALGDMRYEVGDTGQALECYKRSLRLRQEVGDRAGEGWMLHHLARVYLARELSGPARELIDRAARIAADCGDDELRTALERLRRGAAL
jgi:serine/threonine protein kinase/tetratricopeptide (TPR) repeat protein